jgi:hypothetical protein
MAERTDSLDGISIDERVRDMQLPDVSHLGYTPVDTRLDVGCRSVFTRQHTTGLGDLRPWWLLAGTGHTFQQLLTRRQNEGDT